MKDTAIAIGTRPLLTSPAERVTSMNGVTVQAQASLEDARAADAVLIGSGRRTRDIVQDVQIDPSRQLVGSQCSRAHTRTGECGRLRLSHRLPPRDHSSGVDGTRTRKGPEKTATAPENPSGDGANRRDSTRFEHGSRPFRHTVEELEAALVSVTRALGSASGDAVVVLAGERAALRAELYEMQQREGAGLRLGEAASRLDAEHSS